MFNTEYSETNVIKMNQQRLEHHILFKELLLNNKIYSMTKMVHIIQITNTANKGNLTNTARIVNMTWQIMIMSFLILTELT